MLSFPCYLQHGDLSALQILLVISRKFFPDRVGPPPSLSPHSARLPGEGKKSFQRAGEENTGGEKPALQRRWRSLVEGWRAQLLGGTRRCSWDEAGYRGGMPGTAAPLTGDAYQAAKLQARARCRLGRCLKSEGSR